MNANLYPRLRKPNASLNMSLVSLGVVAIWKAHKANEKIPQASRRRLGEKKRFGLMSKGRIFLP